MKKPKAVWLIGAAVVAVALLVGASGPARPASVAAEDWVPIGDKAGFALTTLKGKWDKSVGAELWLKTDSGWVRGRLENPVMVTPVSR